MFGSPEPVRVPPRRVLCNEIIMIGYHAIYKKRNPANELMTTLAACNTAEGLNKQLLSSLFYDHSAVKGLNLVGNWKIDTADAAAYMKANGEDVLKQALSVYVKKQKTLRFCSLVNDRMYSPFGITVASREDHEMLRRCAAAEKLTKDVVDKAIAQRVLTPECHRYLDSLPPTPAASEQTTATEVIASPSNKVVHANTTSSRKRKKAS